MSERKLPELKSGQDWHDEEGHSPATEFDYELGLRVGEIRAILAAAQPVQEPPSQQPVAWKIGNLVSLTQDDYPSMGAYFVQVWDGDDLVARVYGNSFDEVRERAALVVAPLNKAGSEATSD